MNNISKLLTIVMFVVLLSGCTKKSEVVPTDQVVPVEQESESNDLPATEEIEKETESSSIEEDTSLSNSTEINLAMENYTFSEKEITAKAGSTITVKLTSKDGMHDFVIDELMVKSKALADGQAQDVEIKIPADAGGKTYEFYCSIGQHRKMGMIGKLIIE
jgi:plastocyanin